MGKGLGVFATLVTLVLLLPALMIPGTGGIPDPRPYACGELSIILDTIRTLESGGDYQAKAPNATASGAYQYVDGTWRSQAARIGVDTALYPTARSAPPHVQDRVAGANVTQILADHNNDISVIPVIWYLPAALNNPDLMDKVPAGNKLTIREYQTKWLATYNTKVADTEPATATSCTTTTDGTWSLPAPRDNITAGTLDDTHHDYPAWDLIIAENTPIYAITGGTVSSIQHFNGNWWAVGCGGPTPPAGCTTCGNGATIETDDGLRHTYCHNNRLYIKVGDTVVPGQHIADSGNTGRSGTPHLHLELRINGTQRCPLPLIAAVYDNMPVPNPHDLPTTGCTH